MAEQDPREYRGGAHEPEEDKGGPETWADNEGVVPRDMVDEPEAHSDEPGEQGLSDDALGQVTNDAGTTTSEDDTHVPDRESGDEADATSRSGTGANVEDAKHEVAEGEPTAWPESAGAASADTGTN